MKHHWMIRLEWKGNPRRWKWHRWDAKPSVMPTRKDARDELEFINHHKLYPNHVARVVKVRIVEC